MYHLYMKRLLSSTTCFFLFVRPIVKHISISCIDAENCASDYPPPLVGSPLVDRAAALDHHPGLKESERESGLQLPTASGNEVLTHFLGPRL